MKISDKIKSPLQRRPPTEEEIARAQANTMREEALRQDGEAGPYVWSELSFQ
jgi:hypothetical protein